MPEIKATSEEIRKLVADGEEFCNQIEVIYRDIVLPTLEERNHKYGDRNLTRRALKGIASRTEDKCARLWDRKEVLSEEGFKDTLNDFLDIAGYGLNGLRYLLLGRFDELKDGDM